MMKLRSVFAGALLALGSIAAQAQSSYPSPGGATVAGALQMCLNSSGNAVPVSSGTCANPAQVSGTFTSSAAVGITPTDRTITSASGASQQIMAANASRHSLTIENTGNANCGVNPTGGTAAIGGAGTLTLAPLGSYTPSIPTLSAVTVICTAGQPIYANEN
jgi:hypothetical protein